MEAGENRQTIDTTHPAWAQIAVGRGALAARHLSREKMLRESGAAADLFGLLWHEELPVRRAAALALSGGDRDNAYVTAYGHFSGAFLRGLNSETEKAAPETAEARYAAIVAALRKVLDQNASEIRSMNNMGYSFLGNALYLALFTTCRDALEAARRLRAVNAHPEMCRLLWHLVYLDTSRNVNRHDVGLLEQGVWRAIAALPADEIPEFWRGFAHPAMPRRLAAAHALSYFHDRRAVPSLLEVLPDQPVQVAQMIIQCLGRLSDIRALPALSQIAISNNRLLRNRAKYAMSIIERGNAGTPQRTLLRPVIDWNMQDRETLLRPASTFVAAESPDQLLHVHGA